MGSLIRQAGRSLAKNRSEAIDRIVAFLALGECDSQWVQDHSRSRAGKEFRSFPLSSFDGAQPFCYESLLGTTSYDRRFLLDDPELKTLPLQRWDTSMLIYDEGAKEVAEKDLGKQYLYSLLRVRQVPLKEVRGIFRPMSGVIVDFSYAGLCNDATYFTQREICEFRGGKWFTVADPLPFPKPLPWDEHDAESIWVTKSVALTSEYDWFVRIGYNRTDLPTVAIASDPLGAKDVFRLRDVPANATRREALKHWVSGHWRTRRETPAETYIWPYLRGAEEFTWNGLYCRIQPSAHDLRKAKEFDALRGRIAPSKTV